VPGFDIAAEARQYATAHLAGRFSPESLGKTAADELLALLPVLRRLPRRLDRVTSALEQGRLSVNVRLLADERDRWMITGLTHQVLQTAIGAAAAQPMGLSVQFAGSRPSRRRWSRNRLTTPIGGCRLYSIAWNQRPSAWAAHSC